MCRTRRQTSFITICQSGRQQEGDGEREGGVNEAVGGAPATPDQHLITQFQFTPTVSN